MGTDQRAQVWAKTDGHCWYCGKKMDPFEDFTEDHMDPRCQGGGDEVENLQPACKRCNSRKNGRTVEEYRTRLAGNGQLRFWGELSRKTAFDEEEELPICLDEFNDIVKDCLYLGAYKRTNLDTIMIAFTQMVYTWSRSSTSDGLEFFKGHGNVNLRQLSTVLRLPIAQVCFSILDLNKLGIITSSPTLNEYEGGRSIYFCINTAVLSKAALDARKS